VLFHCKSGNQQKTTIFALILWEEQRLNRSLALLVEETTVIFSHHQVCVTRRKEDTFFIAQSESRISAPFVAPKTV
jgi:hypothetical protein